MNNGDVYFEHLLLTINNARRSIRFEVYIFSNDRIGERVAQALEAAAARGVRIRVIVDGVGSPDWSLHFFERFKKAGIRARVYHPYPWDPASRRRPGTSFLASVSQTVARLNRRNHRKTCVIDSRIAFVGSANVSETHLVEFMGERAWRDMIARVEGPAVIWLVAAFEMAWSEPFYVYANRWKRTLRRLTKNRYRELRDLVELNDTLGRRIRNARNFRMRIAESKRRVWLANPYFVPSTLLIRTLNQAARSGIDVRILTPATSDVVFMPWATRQFYGTLLKAGVRVFEYLPAMLHAKTTLVDNRASIGSMNLNHRSLIHDLETNVAIEQPHSIRAIENQFLEDLASSREVRYVDWLKRPLWERLMGRIVLFFKWWI